CVINSDTAADVVLGATNSASVRVLSATNGAFLLQCTVSVGTNSNFQTCSTNVVVNSSALPTIVCPSNLVFNCAQDVPPPDTNSVSVSGATNVTFAGDLITTNTCGLSILRSYQAVNSCGEATNCTQLIIVANTNLPFISCASNLTVECCS